MSLLKTVFLALGLMVTSTLGACNNLNAADIEAPNDPDSIEAVDVIIQMDEIIPTDSISIPMDPIPGDADPAVEQPLMTAQERNWKITHSIFNILADVTSLAGSAVFICTPTIDNPLLFPVSAAMAAGASVIDIFRGFTPKLAEIKEHPGSVTSVCTILNTVGQAVSIAGLTILARGAPIEVGAWLAVGGGLLKFTTASIELGTKGIAKTFGDDHTTTNSIFRIGLLGVGGTVGGILLASGVSSESQELIVTGIYTLASCSLIGNSEVLVRDIQEINSLVNQTE